MNLIEQLGGYERAKAFLNAASYTMDELIMMQRSGLRTQHVEKALLEYRRQHNIFEVGDYAIDEQHTGLLRVTRVMKKRLDADYLNPQTLGFICHHSILIRHIRHATEEEIKAGKRLEVK